MLGQLARRGHRVVDTDDDGWREEAPAADGAGVEQLWRQDRISALLAGAGAGVLFVSGTVADQGEFSDRLDAVVLLSCAREVLLARIASRVGPFGKDPAERAQVLADLRDVEPLLRATATAEIDTDRPLPEVVDAVEAMSRSSPRPG